MTIEQNWLQLSTLLIKIESRSFTIFVNGNYQKKYCRIWRVTENLITTRRLFIQMLFIEVDTYDSWLPQHEAQTKAVSSKVIWDNLGPPDLESNVSSYQYPSTEYQQPTTAHPASSARQPSQQSGPASYPSHSPSNRGGRFAVSPRVSCVDHLSLLS